MDHPHIERLKRDLQDLEDRLHAAQQEPGISEADIRRIKVKKLRLKDAISAFDKEQVG